MLQVKRQKNTSSEKVKYATQCFPTGPTRWIMTSRTSTQPLSDSTSNRANMAFPTLSKLKFRGLALRKEVMNILISNYRKKTSVIKQYKKNKHLYQTLGTQKPGLFSPGFSFRLRFLETLTLIRNMPRQSSYNQQHDLDSKSKTKENVATILKNDNIMKDS